MNNWEMAGHVST